MNKKGRLVKKSADKPLLFPPSAYTTCATVNVYKCMAEKTEGTPGEKQIRKTEAELAEELRNWSIENKL